MLIATTTLLPVIETFKLQTRLFLNVTKDITDEHAKTPIAGSPNHIAWITGHIVSSRFGLGFLLGMTEKEPFPELFERQKGIQNTSYPSMDQLTEGWEAHADKFISFLENLTEDDLLVDPPIRTPIEEQTLRGFITFLAHHEAYHIGQLSLARRLFGYDPMSYV